VKDKMVPFICLASPFLTYLANYIALESFGFDFGFSLLILNGCITFTGLYFFKKK
jgi:SSS family solute:Na+ symporter